MSPAALGGPPGVVVVDCAALQSPTSRGRGIGRYARALTRALEAARPGLVARYLLDPGLPPPGELEDLLATGKVAYRGEGAVPEGARVLHSLSPLDVEIDLEALWPAEAFAAGLRRSATVYDLIPALDPAANLADPLVARRYRTRLEALRAADQLHAISAAVGNDLVGLLGVPPERVVVVGAAPEARFRPRGSGASGPARDRLARLGVRPPFVLAPTGSHPRKNNEGLLAAWARLPPELAGKVQLVLTGDLPRSVAGHLRHVAFRSGFASQLVLTGEIGDLDLVTCFQEALVVCFASLAEGYGLPVAEAIACGTPVVVHDRPPLDELVGPAARVDAADPGALGEALARAIDDPGERARLLAAAKTPLTWEDVAERSAAALEALAGSPRRPRPSSAAGLGRPPARRRVALVSPFPPAASGVAGYSHRLAAALAAASGPDGEGLAVTGFADGPTPDQHPPEGATGWHRVEALEHVERLEGRFDAVVYAFGNSHHHLGALAMLRRRAGVVVAHDVRLSNLYRHEAGEVGRAPGGLARAIRAMYGPGLPDGLGASGALGPAELERYGLLMAREVVARSTRFLVSSASAEALARADARPEHATRVARLPFAFAGPGEASGGFAGPEGASDRPWPETWSGPVVAHFGIVDPSKAPDLLLEAFASVLPGLPGARLAFVGPISEALEAELSTRAERLGIGGAVGFSGPVPPEAYARALASATVAVQLRTGTNGEASAAVGDCLAAGLATVVSDLGWARELPGEAVVKVAGPDPSELGGILAGLLGDPDRRRRLATGARSEAARRSFAATAAALVEAALGDPARNPGRHGSEAGRDAGS